jgi:hypothetical protein
MPIPSENVEIVLQGLDQKTATKLVAPGRLERALNVQFDKAGQLDKRTGYTALAALQADGVGLPNVMSRFVRDGDALVVLSTSRAFALHDADEGLQSSDRAMTSRGWVSSGNISKLTIAVSTDSEDV